MTPHECTMLSDKQRDYIHSMARAWLADHHNDFVAPNRQIDNQGKLTDEFLRMLERAIEADTGFVVVLEEVPAYSRNLSIGIVQSRGIVTLQRFVIPFDFNTYCIKEEEVRSMLCAIERLRGVAVPVDQQGAIREADLRRLEADTSNDAASNGVELKLREEPPGSNRIVVRLAKPFVHADLYAHLPLPSCFTVAITAKLIDTKGNVIVEIEAPLNTLAVVADKINPIVGQFNATRTTMVCDIVFPEVTRDSVAVEVHICDKQGVVLFIAPVRQQHGGSVLLTSGTIPSVCVEIPLPTIL